MQCKHVEDRLDFQFRLRKMNASWLYLRPNYNSLHVGTLESSNSITTPKREASSIPPSYFASSSANIRQAFTCQIVALLMFSHFCCYGIRPDGDSNLHGELDYSTFNVPSCEKCFSGIMVRHSLIIITLPPRFISKG